MVRVLLVLASLGLALGFTPGLVAQTGDGAGGVLKRPLDLPSGGLGDDDDEEDAPESINFYGAEYEGDGFFWCLDKSGSMSWGGRINVLKDEMTQAINALSTRAEFSMVAFSSNYITWNPQPQKANPTNKASAIAWVQTLQANGWTCLKEAGIQTVQISNICAKRRKQIIVLSDGVPVCNGQNTAQQCLTEITGANWQGTPVNTIYISTDSAGVNFMQSLAQLNGGTFNHAGQ